MPLYQYQCRECETSFEAKKSYLEAHTSAPCPVCGSIETRKQVTAVAVSASSHSSQSIPLRMSNHGGCGCGGACACSN